MGGIGGWFFDIGWVYGLHRTLSMSPQTIAKEAPIHIALRLESLEATKIILESASFDVFNCDNFRRQMVSCSSDVSE